MNQIVAAINMRLWQRTRQENSRFSWLARSITTYIAGGYMVEGENTALDSASQIAFDELEEAQMSMARSEVKPIEPKVGSYERLVGALTKKKQ